MTAMRLPGRHRPRAAHVVGPHVERESAVQHQIRLALEAVGCAVSMTSQVRASVVTPGLPDIWFCHAAWQVSGWIECKTTNGRLSKVQRDWHETAQAAGVNVLVARSPADAVQQVGALPRKRQRACVEIT